MKTSSTRTQAIPLTPDERVLVIKVGSKLLTMQMNASKHRLYLLVSDSSRNGREEAQDLPQSGSKKS